MTENFPDREKTEDATARISSFRKELDDLEAKHQVKLVVYPQFVPSDKMGIFEITICKDVIDVKGMPIPSPFA